MDPETGCGLPTTGQKAKVLIGPASWFWNSIGQIFAGVSMDPETGCGLPLTHQKMRHVMP